jgi:phage-related protein
MNPIEFAGQFRVLCVAGFRGRVLVLHAFEKKSQKTPKSEIDQARKIYNFIMNLEQ